MLVLTRKPNQQLHIGNDIVITIVKVRGNTIRLGIEAPKDVRVIRSELEPKPLSGGAAKSNSQVDAQDDSPQAESAEKGDCTDATASADDAQELAAADQFSAPATVIFEARVQRPAETDSPLKRFTEAKRLRGTFSERNLEDSPLCHTASQDSAAVPRPSGLQNYIAAKHRGALVASSKQVSSARVVAAQA